MDETGLLCRVTGADSCRNSTHSGAISIGPTLVLDLSIVENTVSGSNKDGVEIRGWGDNGVGLEPKV